jgi:hypothetical protein
MIYTLYYYDKEHLEPWLNHYCHIPCIDEIIIQDQNWSPENSLYLYRTVANYIDKFDVKIVILPSNYINPDPTVKRSQFLKYGQSPIRNRVVQFLKGMWILGAPDQIIYGESYADTDRKLVEFERNAKEAGIDRAGYVELFSVTSEGFCPGGYPPARGEHWKHRVTYNINPLRHVGAPIHDNKMHIYRNGGWVAFNTSSGHYGNYDFREPDVKLDLKLLHYHTLTKSGPENPKYKPFKESDIKNLDEHPEHYFEKLTKI